MDSQFAAYHLLIWSLNGKKIRIFGELNDAEFEFIVSAELKFPKGCYFVHVPQSEFESGSKRVDMLRSLPVAELSFLSISGGHIINFLYNQLCAGVVTSTVDDWRSFFRSSFKENIHEH